MISSILYSPVSIILLISSFTEYLLSADSVPDTVLGAGDTAANKTGVPALARPHSRQMVNERCVFQCYVKW